MTALLTISDLRLHFDTQGGRVHALNGVDLVVNEGEVLGIVGETGSGKSVTARAILRLLDRNARVSRGAVVFRGRDLLALPEREMQAIRGRDIAMVFQDARNSLNPVFSVGHQLARVALVHQRLSSGAARRAALDMLTRVGISEPERRFRQYPHELSGGMCQRVMIAMALICSPRLIILDEPTTGLDVTVQAEILDLLKELLARTGASVILITHDLGVIGDICQRVAVMYAGQIVENAPVEAIFERPFHPYTEALHGARLAVDDVAGTRLITTIPGSVPDLRRLPPGCAFAARCPYRAQVCANPPDVRELAAGHTVRCFNAEHVASRRAAEATAP
jgi:peptide/nickel transport system ATP-binding protein